MREPQSNTPISAAGVNQTRARDHNERLLLTLIQRRKALPGSELARISGLSPQTVSVILRQLERDGILLKGEPIRGKVGKPSVPMQLDPDGILSVGLKIGRRSADLVLMDVSGEIRSRETISYRYPVADRVFGFLESGLDRMTQALSPAARRRIAGLGVALPFQMWKWHSAIGAPQDEMEAWRNVDITNRVAQFTDLPVLVDNDATAACRAEDLLGSGSKIADFGYFFVGSFIGGGVVLNHSVWEGRTGNAGAFGSLPVGPNGGQLLDHASLYLLEGALAKAGHSVDLTAASQADWDGFGPVLDDWLAEAATALGPGHGRAGGGDRLRVGRDRRRCPPRDPRASGGRDSRTA